MWIGVTDMNDEDFQFVQSQRVLKVAQQQ
jgi:hypothetical protein